MDDSAKMLEVAAVAAESRASEAIAKFDCPGSPASDATRHQHRPLELQLAAF